MKRKLLVSLFCLVLLLPLYLRAQSTSTFYYPAPIAMPEGTFAYVVDGVDGDYVDLKKVEGVIPAGTATLISQVELQNSGDAADLNYLCGTAVDTYIQIESDYSYYVLEESEGTIWLLQDINVNEGRFLNNANKAYLKIPKTLVQDKSKLYIRGLSAPEQVDPSACSHTTYNKGFCSNCGAYQPATDSNSDGTYEIGNAGQLFWFSAHVNSGNRSSKAVMTADIDLENRPWTPIGLYKADPFIDLSYTGTFDGQKHIIKNLNVHVTDGREAGFFSRTRDASLSNFGIVNATIVSDPVNSNSYRAGVVGGELEACTVNNVYTCGNLSVTTEHEQKGGFAGECHSTTLYNCYTTHHTFTSTIGVTANNCFYLGNEENASSAGTFMTAAQMASGEMAYKLGAAYGQTIGTDATPVFGGAKVNYGYASCDDVEKVYTNAEVSDVPLDHNYVNGICSTCEGYEMATDSNSDGTYEIGNAGQLFWFAAHVNSGNRSSKAVMTADIDLENRPWTPIGLYNSTAYPSSDLPYTGTFDGQKHIIKNLNVHVTDGREAGFFSRTRHASLSNFGIVNATIVSDPIDGSSYRAGVVGGEVHLSTVNNVYTSGNLSVTTEHEQKGGFAGECHTTTLYNCYTTHHTFTSTIGVTANNCFYLGNEENASSAGTFMTAAQMASGEMAYKLGAAYGQTIGTDPLPVFDGAKVYYGYTSCGAEEKIYTNDDSVTDEKEHHFADGICTECGDPYVPKITLALYDDFGDGWNGCAIIVKKDDEALAEVTIEEGSDAIHKIEYDPSAKYTFYWKNGGWSEECSFVISVEGETVYNGNLSGDWRNNTTTPFLTLTTPYTLAFSANGGVGSHVAIKALRLVTLPECNFLAPDGKEFSAWRIGESEYQAGDVVTLTENAVAYAVWKDATIAMGTLTLELRDINCESISRLQNYSYYTVTKDGELCATIRLENDFVVSKTLEYDPNCEYAFYWHTGSDTYDTPIVYIQLNEESLFDGSGSSLEHRAEDNPFLVIPKKTRPSNVSTLNIIDGELPEYLVLKEAKIDTLTYTRTLPNQKWNALYLPFEIPASELIENYDVAYFNNMHAYDNDKDGSIDEMEMEVIPITEGILHANHPYFIRAKNEEAKNLKLVLFDATINTTEETSLTCSSVYMNFSLTGVYSRRSASDLDGCYAISVDGDWSPIAAGSYLNPFRLYLQMTSRDGSPVKVTADLKSIRIRFKDEITEIDDILQDAKQTESVIYDLSGRRVLNPQKGGLYIVNGKKVIY